LLLPSQPPPPPNFASPVVGWLLHCFPPSAFVIAHRHATVNAFVAGRFCHQSLSTAAATGLPLLPLPPPPPSSKHTIIHCQRKRQQQHHHQHTNGSTNVKTFTNPVDLDLFTLIYSI
jgi:hypothetical protein